MFLKRGYKEKRVKNLLDYHDKHLINDREGGGNEG